jgi:hypothetical protein
VTTFVPGVHHALQLGIIVGTGKDRYIAYGRIIPMRSRGRDFEALVPGAVSNDNLGIFDHVTLKVRVSS